jgi:hypothetical protein
VLCCVVLCKVGLVLLISFQFGCVWFPLLWFILAYVVFCCCGLSWFGFVSIWFG